MEASREILTVPLDRCDTAAVSLVGGKAHHLGKALVAGLPVPQGVVVTTAAFARWAASCLDGVDGSSALPRELTAELSAIGARLGSSPLAVRSSSPAEDLPGASFAGQYTTTLQVHGVDRMAQAIVATWRSAAAPAARGYARGGSSPTMAVLIQRMVPARISGVAFTADPVSGDTATTVVEAVAGLGDRLVSGECTPEEWEVRGTTVRARRRGSGPVLDEATVLRVASLAQRCADLLGGPADIEWALDDDGQIQLLQLRPITALPEPQTVVPEAVRHGYWQLDTSHFPKPVSPLGASVIFPAAERSLAEGLGSLGLLLDAIKATTVGGWMYTQVVPLGGENRKPPPRPLLWLAVRLHPTIRRRVWSGVKAVEQGRPQQIIHHWNTHARPQLQHEISKLTDVPLTSLDDRALQEHLRAVERLVRLGWDAHVPAHMAMVVILGTYVAVARELLGWDEAEAVSLLAGLSTTSTAPGRALDSLADEAIGSPELTKALLTEDPDPELLRGISPTFGRRFDAYLAEFGCRPLGYDPADALLEEKPQYILALLADKLRGDAARSNAAIEAANSNAEQALAKLSGSQQARFQTALSQAKKVYGVREDNVFYAVSSPCGVLHRAAREAGRRLVSKSNTDNADDAFFLSMDELCDALAHGRNVGDTVQRRRADLERSARAVPPAHFGDPPAPPPLSILPRRSQLIHQAFNWYANTQTTAHPALGGSGRDDAAAGSSLVSGTGASAGSYVGRVRLILNEFEMDRIEPGDVVVTPATSPTWAIAFPRIGALVTNEGGVLSHPAIIAREYRVPAVVGARNATRILHEGQIVTVNGTNGTVHAQEARHPRSTTGTTHDKTTQGASS